MKKLICAALVAMVMLFPGCGAVEKVAENSLARATCTTGGPAGPGGPGPGGVLTTTRVFKDFKGFISIGPDCSLSLDSQ